MIRNPTFVICLERKNKERCDVNFPIVKQLFPQAERMDAVDANNIDIDNSQISTFSKYHLQTTLDTDILHLSMKGAVGCALSHINAWKKIASLDEPGFVIEDDVDIKGLEPEIMAAYQKIPTDIDFASLMYLNWGSTKKHHHSRYNEHWLNISSRYFSGTQLYYLTPDGAKKLLQHVFPITTHIDIFIAYFSATKSNDFNGIFLNNNIYPFHLELQDNMNSTLGHGLQVKKMLPDENSFYYVFVASYLILIIVCIVIFIHRKR